jgi:two-component system nitrate/nitrite sensor histidine kinase NarX
MKIVTSIRGRLSLLFLAFVLLVTISVGITFWGINTQKTDALVINLAGRQRMLVQQMTRLAEGITRGSDQGDQQALLESAQIFEATLTALQYGGQAPYLPGQLVDLPAPRSSEVQSQLARVHQTWELFRPELDDLANAPQATTELAGSLQVIQVLSPQLVAQADMAVRLFEAGSIQKVIRLRSIQIAFFTSALILVAVGAWITKRSVLQPLQAFGHAAERIGAGDLSTPTRISEPEEFAVLAQTFDSMQTQLKSSHEELVDWAETLEKRVAQRTRELDALYEVSRDISSRLDVQHVLSSVTEKARQLLDGEVASLCLLEEDGRTLSIKALSGPDIAITGNKTNGQSGLAGDVLSGKQALACGVGQCAGVCAILAHPYRTSHLAAPLWFGDRVIGALCVGSQSTDVFSPEASNLLTKLANSAAIALENARLYTQAERVAALEERQRIAADMHDGLGQTLSYLGLSIDMASDLLEVGQDQEALQYLERSRSIIDQATNEVRDAITSLMDDSPPQQSLQNRLAALVEEYNSQSEALLAWESTIETTLVLSRDEAEQVFRVANEALLNAQNHAGASFIRVCVELASEDFVLSVVDDGQGFELANQASDGRGHFGLQIMHARAARLGGSLKIQSAPREGTQVILRWPVKSNTKVQMKS